MTIKSILIIALIIAVAVWGIYTTGLKFERDRLSAELATATFNIQALDKELAAGRRALKEREAEKARLINEKTSLLFQLSELYENDPKARHWAADPCPDSIIDCLLQMPAGAAQ